MRATAGSAVGGLVPIQPIRQTFPVGCAWARFKAKTALAAIIPMNSRRSITE